MNNLPQVLFLMPYAEIFVFYCFTKRLQNGSNLFLNLATNMTDYFAFNKQCRARFCISLLDWYWKMVPPPQLIYSSREMRNGKFSILYNRPCIRQICPFCNLSYLLFIALGCQDSVFLGNAFKWTFTFNTFYFKIF